MVLDAQHPDARNLHAPAPSDAADEDAIAARMAERYGTDRSNWRIVAVATAAIAVFVVTAAWVGVQIVDRPFEARVMRSAPESERVVEVDIEVRGESNDAVECIVRVKDVNAADVGYARITLANAPATETFRIPTVVRASSVEVLGCATQGEELVVPPADYPPGVAPPADQPLS